MFADDSRFSGNTGGNALPLFSMRLRRPRFCGGAFARLFFGLAGFEKLGIQAVVFAVFDRLLVAHVGFQQFGVYP